LGAFVPGPREVTEALWNTCCAPAVATDLTGSVHRSNRCHRSDRCSTGNKPCKFSLCVLVCFGSEGCLLVPRSSGYVGLTNLGSESETCVGSRVRLVGVSISFEKNFYRLPFTPPSLVRRFSPSSGIRAGSGLY
jgi:hypothetical protein